MFVYNLRSQLFVYIYRYTWEKNGKPFDWQVYDDRMAEQPGRGTLVITSPRDEDIGESLILVLSLNHQSPGTSIIG